MIYEDWVDPKVARILQKQSFMPGMGLGKNGTGVKTFPNFPGQTSKAGLGYVEGQDKGKAKKKGESLYDYFVREGHGQSYHGQRETQVINGEIKPGFEIFNDVVAKWDSALKIEDEEEELMVLERKEEL